METRTAVSTFIQKTFFLVCSLKLPKFPEKTLKKRKAVAILLFSGCIILIFSFLMPQPSNIRLCFKISKSFQPLRLNFIINYGLSCWLGLSYTHPLDKMVCSTEKRVTGLAEVTEKQLTEIRRFSCIYYKTRNGN